MDENKVPDHWELVTAEDVCDYIQRGKQPKYSDGGRVKIINQRCIYWDELKLENARGLSEEQRPKWQEYRYLQDGDVLVNSTGVGTVGRAQIFREQEEPYVVDGHVTVMRPSKDLDSRFLYYFLRSEAGQNQITPEGATGQVELRKKDVLNIELPLPPLSQQCEIAKELDSLFEKIDEICEEIGRMEEIVNELPKSVLKESFQGKLVDWNPDDLHCKGSSTPSFGNEGDQMSLDELE